MIILLRICYIACCTTIPQVEQVQFELNKTTLTEIIPDVHLATEGPHFDDLLTQKVVRLTSELGT